MAGFKQGWGTVDERLPKESQGKWCRTRFELTILVFLADTYQRSTHLVDLTVSSAYSEADWGIVGLHWESSGRR